MYKVRATPEFIPHEAWDIFAWLLPRVKRTHPWYYAAIIPSSLRSRSLPSNPKFLSTVDKPLQKIVSWLHQQEIITGPSCSGHSLEEPDLKSIYRGLQEDSLLIKAQGLPLYNPETGKIYLLQDEQYKLPWPSSDEFCAAATKHQTVGWLPFYTKDSSTLSSLGSFSGFCIIQVGPHAYVVRTEGKDPNVWETVFATLQKALK